MVDTLSKAERSALMGKIKSKGTRPEKDLARALKKIGALPSRKGKALPGRPDAAFRAAKVAVFVDGCFWHGCPLHGRLPKSDAKGYWKAKIKANSERDERWGKELMDMGWMVLRVWEHDLKKPQDVDEQAVRVARAVEARLGGVAWRATS